MPSRAEGRSGDSFRRRSRSSPASTASPPLQAFVSISICRRRLRLLLQQVHLARRNGPFRLQHSASSRLRLPTHLASPKRAGRSCGATTLTCLKRRRRCQALAVCVRSFRYNPFQHVDLNRSPCEQPLPDASSLTSILVAQSGLTSGSPYHVRRASRYPRRRRFRQHSTCATRAFRASAHLAPTFARSRPRCPTPA